MLPNVHTATSRRYDKMGPDFVENWQLGKCTQQLALKLTTPHNRTQWRTANP